MARTGSFASGSKRRSAPMAKRASVPKPAASAARKPPKPRVQGPPASASPYAKATRTADRMFGVSSQPLNVIRPATVKRRRSGKPKFRPV